MAKSVARERRVRFRHQPKAAARANLYDRDMYRWTRQQARLLRAGRMSELDLENLAEEIQSLGNSEESGIECRLQVLLSHLLKWQVQSGRRKGGWRGTIVEQRYRLQRRLRRSPSLAAYPRENHFWPEGG